MISSSCFTKLCSALTLIATTLSFIHSVFSVSLPSALKLEEDDKAIAFVRKDLDFSDV
ncbi:uncharacterized protein G2W53_038405 [Senna tora]|uniref:Uncharacterized protein n=1 Tax=Senna tora TaxID=362788 RepID=A0A834SLP0_9FABA|nr:uncharacterized protein G2W53_038405 [Senna tora]